MKTISGDLRLVVVALLTCALAVGCGATASDAEVASDRDSLSDTGSKPPGQPTNDSADSDGSRVARLFVAFAQGETDGLPVDTPVVLYLGNSEQRTIPDGKSDRRSQWRLCDEYAQHACPMSALDVVASTPGEVLIGDSVTSTCLETLAEPAGKTGGSHQVVLSPPEPKTCADDYAVQIWTNDVGQIVAVNLLLGASEDSPNSNEALVLGPDGVGQLRLGMTHQQVSDTNAGRVHVGSRHDGWPPGCRLLQYQPKRLGRTPGDTTNAVISDKHGLERVYATPKMVTPEGISLGSTILDVRDAYNRPGLTSGDLVVVPASNHAVYRIQLGGVVVSMSLEVRRPACNR